MGDDLFSYDDYDPDLAWDAGYAYESAASGSKTTASVSDTTSTATSASSLPEPEPQATAAVQLDGLSSSDDASITPQDAHQLQQTAYNVAGMLAQEAATTDSKLRSDAEKLGLIKRAVSMIADAVDEVMTWADYQRGAYSEASQDALLFTSSSSSIASSTDGDVAITEVAAGSSGEGEGSSAAQQAEEKTAAMGDGEAVFLDQPLLSEAEVAASAGKAAHQSGVIRQSQAAEFSSGHEDYYDLLAEAQAAEPATKFEQQTTQTQQQQWQQEQIDREIDITIESSSGAQPVTASAEGKHAVVQTTTASGSVITVTTDTGDSSALALSDLDDGDEITSTEISIRLEHTTEPGADRASRLMLAAVLLSVAQIVLLAWALLAYSYFLKRSGDRADEPSAMQRIEVLEKRLDAMC
jgi:hypothetical protein